MQTRSKAYLYVFARVGNGALIDQCIATTVGNINEVINQVTREAKENNKLIFLRVSV